MSEHRIELEWERDDAPFARNAYSRDHLIRFAGGQTLYNSAAAGVYGGNAKYSTPEELLLAALSSCHMLTFLAVAANRGYTVDSYEDAAVATLEKNAQGQMVVTEATLTPRVKFSGDKQPDSAQYAALQQRAHVACFIANSVKTTVKLKLD